MDSRADRALPPGLYKDSSGRYLIKFRSPDGRRTTRRVGSDYETALAEHARLTAAEASAQGNTQHVSARELLRVWLQDLARRGKPRTLISAKSHINRFMEYVGDGPARGAILDGWERFTEARRAEGVSAATINATLRCVKAAVNFGRERELVDDHWPRLRLLRQARRKDVVPFTGDELAAVMEKAEPRVRALIAIASSNGLRTSEILWLRWDDLESDGTLHIRPKVERIMRRGQEVEVRWSPKSHQARSVVLPPNTLKEIKRYREELESERSEWEAKRPQVRLAPNPWMFPGTRRRHGRWGAASRRALIRAFDAAGVYEPGRLVHAIRHSFASHCNAKGVGIETLRQILGHASPLTTAGYLHTDKKKLADAAALGDLLG